MAEKELIRLTYCSTATFPVQKYSIEPEIGRILVQCRKNNRREEIGGVLHFGNGFFFQALEGDRARVNKLYNHIATDPRHEDVQVLSVKTVPRRMFPDWSMKYVALEERIKALLHSKRRSNFNPYKFDEAFVDELLQLFVSAEDPSVEKGRGNDADAGAQGKGGWFKRLFGAQN